jgi:hypothetical protein
MAAFRDRHRLGPEGRRRLALVTHLRPIPRRLV